MFTPGVYLTIKRTRQVVCVSLEDVDRAERVRTGSADDDGVTIDVE